MPELPKDWLGWVTLVGSIAGILAAFRVFLYEKWLNRNQRRLLVATYFNEYKLISTMHVFGGGWIFHIPTNNKAKNFYDYFMNGGPDEISSYRNLIYLKELVEKGYLVYRREATGIKGTDEDIYYLTAKGLRYGRVLRYVTMKPRMPIEQQPVSK
jgi:hypothetical protein